MTADGGDMTQLTNEPGRDYEPDTSPDGATIVFVSDRDTGSGSAQLYLMDADGGNPRQLTFSHEGAGGSVVDDYPHWSPDGRRIAFQRTVLRPGTGPDADIWVIDTATGEERQLTDTPDAWDSTPDFTADGRGVLFESDRSGEFDIHRIDVDTGDIVPLARAPGRDLEAKTSPDGQRIAFASERGGNYDIYTMAADGADVRQLTTDAAADRCPHWSPDGTRIAFYSSRDGNQEIYVMNADGSGQTRITNTGGDEEVPDWVHAP